MSMSSAILYLKNALNGLEALQNNEVNYTVLFSGALSRGKSVSGEETSAKTSSTLDADSLEKNVHSRL